MTIGSVFSKTSPARSLHLLGQIDFDGMASVQNTKSLVGDIALSGSCSFQWGGVGDFDLRGAATYSIRYAGFLDFDGTVRISATPPTAGWGSGHIDLDGTCTFGRSLLGKMDMDGSCQFLAFPPNSISIPVNNTPIKSDDPVGTEIAEVQQEGGIQAAYDATWTIIDGSTKARLRGTAPIKGKLVSIEVKTVYGTDTGDSHVTVQATGGELGSTKLTKRVDFVVNAAASGVTWRSGLSNASAGGNGLSTAADAAVFGTWRGRAVRCILINSGLAGSTWSAIAATSDKLGGYGSKMATMAAADMYPIFNLPVATSASNFAAIANATAATNNQLYKDIKAVATAYMAALNGNAGAARFGWEPTQTHPWEYANAHDWGIANTSGPNPTVFQDAKDAWGNLHTIFHAAAAAAGNTKFQTHWCQHYGWDQYNAKLRDLDQVYPSVDPDVVTIDIYDAFQAAINAASSDRTAAGYIYTDASYANFAGAIDKIRTFADNKSVPWGIDEWGLMDYALKSNKAGNDNLLWPQAMFDYCTDPLHRTKPHHESWFHAIDTLGSSYPLDSHGNVINTIHNIVALNSAGDAIIANGPWNGPSPRVNAAFSGAYVGTAAATAAGKGGEAAARYKLLWSA